MSAFMQGVQIGSGAVGDEFDRRSKNRAFVELMKQKAKEEEEQSFARAVRYDGVDPMTLSKADRLRGLAGPTLVPETPEVPDQYPQTMVGMAKPAVPAHNEYDADPNVAKVQRVVGRGQKATDLAANEADAKLKNTQADTVKKLADAGGTHYKLSQAALMLSGGDPDKKESMEKMLLAEFGDKEVPKDFIHNMGTNSRFDGTLGEKHSQFLDKRFTGLGEALDPSKGARGAFGIAKQSFDRAEKLESLASAFPSGNLDSRQIEELAIGMNSLLSGSNAGAASQVEALVPKTVMGDARKLKEWLTNEPTGTNQQAFVKRLLGTIEREKATVSDQMKRIKYERAGRYSDLEKTDQARFKNALEDADIDPDEYDKWRKGGKKAISAVQGAEGGDKNIAGKIKISNGKETLYADPNDVAEAEKEGFKRVE